MRLRVVAMMAAFAAAWLVGMPQSGVAQEQVALQSVQNGKYVRIGAGAHGFLAAVSAQIDWPEKFYLARLGGAEVALQSAHDASYVRAGVGQSSFLAAGSPRIQAWERFQLIELGGDRVALRSVQSGLYVRAGVGQESYLAAVSSQVAGWETFRIVKVPAAVQTLPDSVTVLPQPLYTVPSAPAPSGLPAEMQQMLSAHNAYRAKHCVAPLTWSATLAAAAQKWANGCSLTHSGGGYGENLWWGTAGAFSPQNVVASWYNEIAAYNFSAPDFSPQTGHFTQVVWKGSKELGCGRALCQGKDSWVCLYSPAGNVLGQFPQNVPKLCK